MCKSWKIPQKITWASFRGPISLSPSKAAEQFSRLPRLMPTRLIRGKGGPPSHQRRLNTEGPFNRFRALSQAEPSAYQRPFNFANAAAIAVSGLSSPFCFCFCC